MESEQRIRERERKVSLYVSGILLYIIGVFCVSFLYDGGVMTLLEIVYAILLQAAGGCFFGYLIYVENTRAAHDMKRGALF